MIDIQAKNWNWVEWQLSFILYKIAKLMSKFIVIISDSADCQQLAFFMIYENKGARYIESIPKGTFSLKFRLWCIHSA